MKILRELFSNYALNVAIISWVSAQVIKTIIYLIKNRSFRPERLFGAGGMPSAHSASVCGLTIAIARSMGFGSPVFAIAFLLSAVVMYDAMGVRRAAGEHARAINMIVRRSGKTLSYVPKDKAARGELKEFLGHTPLQVMAGALLGILIAMIIPVS